jgi:carboxypeptidase Taq
MAAQLYAQAVAEDSTLEPALAAGDYQPLRAFLTDRIYQHGRRFTRDELLMKATGTGLDPAPYIAYLTAKYSNLYGLA